MIAMIQVTRINKVDNEHQTLIINMNHIAYMTRDEVKNCTKIVMSQKYSIYVKESIQEIVRRTK